MVKPHILFTGFEPFGRHKDNPSQSLVEKAEGVEKLILPVDVNQAPKVLDAYYGKHTVSAAVHFGLHNRARLVHLERFAVNLDDFRIADNSGIKHEEKPIVEGAPTAYMTSVPVRSLQSFLKDRGLKTRISNTAGTYLCNHVYYHSLKHFSGTDVPVLFVHIPNVRWLQEEKHALLAQGIRECMESHVEAKQPSQRAKERMA
ncbi:MAG: hypothetical protein QCI38_09110 [Candidatus Thermoplasmatota archaeon]|nr:hypothetical protein [Candidatus Thermoplasmatota archaeon]